jgi:hypothetical protein
MGRVRGNRLINYSPLSPARLPEAQHSPAEIHTYIQYKNLEWNTGRDSDFGPFPFESQQCGRWVRGEKESEEKRDYSIPQILIKI